MIKYFEVDSFDDSMGQRIVSINDDSLTKTASLGFAPDILSYISKMTKREDRYYVVINAVGAFESWGANNNGDSFPRESLSHVSLRSAMGTPNDYGYKTFEYYAKLFKHHANKNHHPSFGEVLYAYWNADMDRVELIVAIDVVSGSDIVVALEAGEAVAVSMGCRVVADECSICGKQAKTRAEYCTHLTSHLRSVVTHEQAKLWSTQVGRQVLPGEKVYARNIKPKFFDISRVRIGADRTAFVLGKVASENSFIGSADLGEVYGVTDSQIDKLAEIYKEIGTSVGDTDGSVISADMLERSVNGHALAAIESELEIPQNILESISAFGARNCIDSLLGLGIHPSPREFQYVMLASNGEGALAKRLLDSNICFDPKSSDAIDVKAKPSISGSIFSIIKDLMIERSSNSPFILNSMNPVMIKTAPEINQPTIPVPMAMSHFYDQAMIFGALAGLYQGLKLKATGMTGGQISRAIIKNPAVVLMIGGGALAKLHEAQAKNLISSSYVPAMSYAGILKTPEFMKIAGYKEQAAGNTIIAAATLFPLAYVAHSYNKSNMAKGGVSSPTASTIGNPVVPVVGTAGFAGLPILKNKLIKSLQ